MQTAQVRSPIFHVYFGGWEFLDFHTTKHGLRLFHFVCFSLLLILPLDESKLDFYYNLAVLKGLEEAHIIYCTNHLNNCADFTNIFKPCIYLTLKFICVTVSAIVNVSLWQIFHNVCSGMALVLVYRHNYLFLPIFDLQVSKNISSWSNLKMLLKRHLG